MIKTKKKIFKLEINLLKKKDLKFSEKLIFFALHYLRYIIVLTQIVVIGVFFYRFIIDQQIIDLKESVEQHEGIVKFTLPMVEDAQAIDKKTSEIKKVLASQQKFVEALRYILSIIPEKITLNKFEMGKQNILITGKSDDFRVVRALYEKIKNDKKFKNIEISQLSRKSDMFEFSMEMSL